jgi:glyoxylase-like metal-dependent hydrolase (beta-lactamase superfamily II)
MTEYDVIAVRYGTFETTKSECYYRYHAYGEADAAIRMDYYFWVVRSGDDVTLVDSGFDAPVGERRGRTPLLTPVAALERLGLQPAQVSRVVATHFHYDHIGNLRMFPEAEILASGLEVDFWTGPWARREQFAQVVEGPEIAYVQTADKEGRLTRLGDEDEIAPGLRTRWVGGHTPGQLVVTVSTGGREVVLASDAVHLYEEVERDRPFAILSDVPEMYQAYELLRDLTSGEDRVLVAGHDPLVMERFPAVDGLDQMAVRLA